MGISYALPTRPAWSVYFYFFVGAIPIGPTACTAIVCNLNLLPSVFSLKCVHCRVLHGNHKLDDWKAITSSNR